MVKKNISNFLIDRILNYIRYYFRADTIYNVHSPFVYDFMVDVLDTKKNYYSFNALEHERKILLSNHNLIEIQDFGAGSKTNNQKKRRISDIAANVLSSRKKCRILFNLVNKFSPENALELGTSLGIATMYMAKASTQNTIYTIEAAENLYKLAKVLFERNHLKNVMSINGTFDEVLPNLCKNVSTFDLTFIDGNHTYEATKRYFNIIAEKCNKSSIIVLDDIYWSEGMKKAWDEIKTDKRVTYSIDVFDLGFLFFDSDLGEKQHFTLIEFYKKPYRIGLF